MAAEPGPAAAPPGEAGGTGRAPPIVGLRREREVLTVALEAGRHVVIEGPPGTGKSTLLRQVAAARHAEFVLVEGSAELTPARLVGSFDPALVLEQGYRPENFSDGPLVRAMRDGGLLYVEELNRVPEETINVLLTVMSEGEINVPRLGRVAADESFRLVAAMNPYDSVGTSRLSMALYDRTCRIALGYQDAEHERQIVQLAAARATLAVVVSEAVPAHLHRVGTRLLHGLHRLQREHAAAVAGVGGVAEMCFLHYASDGVSRAVARGCAARGVLFKRTAYNFVSLAHDEATVDRTLDVLDDVLRSAAHQL